MQLLPKRRGPASPRNRVRTRVARGLGRDGLTVERLESRALLNGDAVTTIRFADMSNLPAPNKIYVGGWINGGQAVQSEIVQVATVVIQSGVAGGQAPAGPQVSATSLTVTSNSSNYVFNPVNPARLTIQGTGFGNVPSANTIVFYEDAAGTILSPVNPGGTAGPFWFSIPDGTETSLTVAFEATASGRPQPNAGPLYARISSTWAYPLKADGTFSTDATPAVPFHDVASLAGGVSLSTATNGNDRLVFVAASALPTATSSKTPWSNYPISALPSNTATVPPGPYGIMEFGYNAQFNTSYVDSFGLNWSFVDDAAPGVVYGVRPTIDRSTMQTAYSTFTGTTGDPLGGPFQQLLWTSTTTPVPAVIDGQFTAIVSPEDWLTPTPSIPPPEFTALQNFWTATVNEFFATGNQLSISLDDTIYSGTASGGTYTLSPGNVVIAKSDYDGTAIFSQPQPDNSLGGQLKDAVFEAFSRGVSLDGVWKAGRSGTMPNAYSSDAWTNYPNWYKPGATTYDPSISRTYNVYAKFFHYATSDGKDFRDVAGGKPMLGLNGKVWFAMAYGFSLDESPSVNTAGGGTWPTDASVNGGTTIDAGGSITVTFGPWSGSTPSAPQVVSIDTNPPQQGSTPTPTSAATVTWTVTFSEAVDGVTAANFALVPGGTLSGTTISQVAPSGTGQYSKTWTVTATTGTGAGTLGLDLTSPGAIEDASGDKLSLPGGRHVGQAYAVRLAPAGATATVTIPNGTPNPTSAATVTFNVSFSAPVTGLSASNFTPIPGGGLAGASVVSVAGSGSAYTVTVGTGSGSGTLALRLATNAGLAPTVTGLPVTSAAYTVRQPSPVAPAVESIRRADPNPTSMSAVSWMVTFSQPVGGVSRGNFELVSWNLTGARITNVVPAPGTGTSWIVTALTGSGTGRLRLTMVNAAGITDAGGLAPTGIPRQGQAYTVERGGATIVEAPISFMTTVGRASTLAWKMAPFTDADSVQLTATLAVPPGSAGSLRATSGGGVTVTPSGTPSTELRFAGSVADLNMFFRDTSGLVTYTPSASAPLSPRTLTLSAQGSDGLAGLATAAVLVRATLPQSPAPTVALDAATLAGTAGVPRVITYDELVAATRATQTTTRSVQFQLNRLRPGGTLEVWTGGRWAPVLPVPYIPLLPPGGRIRWTPPPGATGVTKAFTVVAWDGWQKSGISRVFVSLAS